MVIKRSSIQKLMKGADGKMAKVPIIEYDVFSHEENKDGGVTIHFHTYSDCKGTKHGYAEDGRNCLEKIIKAERIDEVVNHLNPTTLENYKRTLTGIRKSIRVYIAEKLFDTEMDRVSQIFFCKEQIRELINNLTFQDIDDISAAVGSRDVAHEEQIEELTRQYENTLKSISE